MSKFFGKIGYGQNVEKSPGVFDFKITERKYYGDITKISRRFEKSENLHDDLRINNQISILTDAYANNHFANIQYVVWSNTYWKVDTVEVQRPRLILTLGGVYNGPKADDSSST